MSDKRSSGGGKSDGHDRERSLQASTNVQESENVRADGRHSNLHRLINVLSELPELITHAKAELKDDLITKDPTTENARLKEENRILRHNAEILKRENDELKQNKRPTVDLQSKKLTADERLNNLQQQIKKKDKEISYLRDFKMRIQKQENDVNSKHTIGSKFLQTNEPDDEIKRQLQQANRELKNITSELEETKSRLSRALGSNLTDSNPNIADLSDKNRPTNIAEQYQELYDNEWTDAFQIVNRTVNNEDKTVSVLLEILMEVMEYCQTRAETQMNTLRDCLLMSQVKQLPASTKKLSKESRKEVADESGKGLYNKYLAELTKSYSRKASMAQQIPIYVKKCLEICWIMAVQDPPVVLAPVLRPGDHFETNLYKAYSKSGNKVDYVVWPVLLLHKDGPVLCKGVAQGYSEIQTTTTSPPLDRNRDSLYKSCRQKPTQSRQARDGWEQTPQPTPYYKSGALNTKKMSMNENVYHSDYNNYYRNDYSYNIQKPDRSELKRFIELEERYGSVTARSVLGNRYDVCLNYINTYF